jgi:hypothetical protein
MGIEFSSGAPPVDTEVTRRRAVIMLRRTDFILIHPFHLEQNTSLTLNMKEDMGGAVKGRDELGINLIETVEASAE